MLDKGKSPFGLATLLGFWLLEPSDRAGLGSGGFFYGKENRAESMANEIRTAEDLQAKLAELSPAAEGLYYFLPDECWMTEKTMAEALRTHTRAISKAKAELEKAELIVIRREQNKYKRISQIHRILKVHPWILLLIPQEYQWVLQERVRVISPQYQESSNIEFPELKNKPESENQPSTESDIPKVSWNWELLKRYSAADINRMPRFEQAELYMEVGFLVLPTHYPRFGQNGDVSCSCKSEFCSKIGKHPSVKSYRGLTPENYGKRRSRYLRRFKQDKDLNIGFKPFGYSILDVDYKNGGEISLGLLREETQGLDETLTAASANGLHLYTSTAGLSQSVELLGAGLDIRGDKTTGFIVAPCSTHASGKQYRWESIADLQAIPDEWLYENDTADKSVTPRKRGKTGRSLEHILIPSNVYKGYVIPEHQRNDTLFKLASRERGQGASEQHIYDVLVTFRDTYCEESKDPNNPMTDSELRRIAKSAARYPTNAEKLAA